jgi:hypothetical protein
LIRQVIADIKSAYPVGRQNSFFALRYASEEQLSELSLQEVFALLNIRQGLSKQIKQVKYADETELNN